MGEGVGRGGKGGSLHRPSPIRFPWPQAFSCLCVYDPIHVTKGAFVFVGLATTFDNKCVGVCMHNPNRHIGRMRFCFCVSKAPSYWLPMRFVFVCQAHFRGRRCCCLCFTRHLLHPLPQALFVFGCRARHTGRSFVCSGFFTPPTSLFAGTFCFCLSKTTSGVPHMCSVRRSYVTGRRYFFC